MSAETHEFNLVPSAPAIAGGADILGTATWPLCTMTTGQSALAAADRSGGRRSHGPAGGNPATEARLRVTIIGNGSVASESYLALQDAGLEVQLPGRAGEAAAALALICSDDGDPAVLKKANAAALEAEQPFRFAVVEAHAVRVGPLVVPGLSACHECLVSTGKTRQRRVNRQSPYRAVAARIAGSFAAVQLHNFANPGGKQLVAGEVITYDLRSNALSTAVVARHPECPACGGAAA